jgi:predicted RNA-binding protein associated with RNAse of E/G family
LLDDENELIAAHNNKEISDEEFKKCYEIAEKIMDELKNKNNKFVNRGIKDLERFI